jgi:hypothetical protein
MSNHKYRKSPLRWSLRRRLIIEALEGRALLTAATETFAAPASLTQLIQEADAGKVTQPAMISTMIQALETQLESGPLADLNSGAVNGADFVTEVQNLETSYEQSIQQQLPFFHGVDQVLDLEGQRIVANVTALNQESSVGLLSTSALGTQAQAAITALVNGPLQPLNSSLSAYVTTTQNFETSLNTLDQSLSSTASPSLTVTQVSSTVQAEAEAYRADMHSALQVTHPYISSVIDTAVTTLENTVSTLSQDTNSAAQTQLSSAITAFDNAILDTTGLFGSQGVVTKAFSHQGGFSPKQAAGQATTVGNVSGTATTGGTATLVASLTTAGTANPISGQTVDFDLNGAFVGSAVTNSFGVAMLTGVSTSATAGSANNIVASFEGAKSYRASSATGQLTINQAGTTLASVSGTASFGGTATLNATLTSSVTGAGIAGETVNFTLDGTSVGSAVTDSNGVVSLTGVATTDTAGTDNGGVVASFAGDITNAAAPNATGALTVSQAGTTLGSVSGTAASGGTALTATLTSSVTSLALAGETVTFTLDGTSVGSAVTNSSGVASLTGISTSDTTGTHTGAVVANFAGDTKNSSSTGTGDLTVS